LRNTRHELARATLVDLIVRISAKVCCACTARVEWRGYKRHTRSAQNFALARWGVLHDAQKSLIVIFLHDHFFMAEYTKIAPNPIAPNARTEPQFKNQKPNWPNARTNPK